MLTLWLVMALVAGAIELVATHFVLLFVAIAALAAAALARVGASPLAQSLTFGALACALPFVLRQPMLRWAGGREVPSRTDDLQGQPATVTVAIDPAGGPGRVLVAGHDWAATSSARLEPGAPCRVVGADGIVLIVVAEAAAPLTHPVT